jgi:hypothetical protein
MSQHTKQYRQGKKMRRQNSEKKSYEFECPFMIDWPSKMTAEPTAATFAFEAAFEMPHK